jgi:hypothetical protein
VDFFSPTLNDLERSICTDPVMSGTCRSRAKYQM